MAPPKQPKTKVGWDNQVPAFHQGSFIWKGIKLDAWNQYYPYQLLILHDDGDGKYTVTPWRYTLPMSPQELRITMPVADRVEPTLTGYNEIHGGAPFRNISFRGTTGILPQAPLTGRGAALGDTGFATQFTAPVANAASTVLTGKPPRYPNEYPEDKFPENGTGYFYFHQLRQFLEGYVAIKGSKEKLTQDMRDADDQKIVGPTIYPEKVRLAFCAWKDNAVYICRLVNFEMERVANKPFEYLYSLQLQAYRRVDLSVDGKAFDEYKPPRPPGPGIISDVMNRVDGARKTFNSLSNLVNLGIVGPLAAVSEVSRQFSGIVKDTLGIGRSLLDMPGAFINGVLNGAFEIQQSLAAGLYDFNRSAAKLKNLDQAVRDKIDSLGWKRKGPKTGGAGIDAAVATLTLPQVGGGGNNPNVFRRPDVEGDQTMNNANIDPLDFLQENPEIGDIDINSFPMTDEQKLQLQQQIEASRNISVSDVQDMIDVVRDNMNSYMQSIGCSDSIYEETYGLKPATTAPREPTREELDVLFAGNELTQALHQFSVYLQEQGGGNKPRVTSIEYIAGLASRSGMDFVVPRSKYAVPFPYGSSLERVALLYLGDANRWFEIATLNGLRAPYVDEVGFELPLMVNGHGNEIQVADATNLFIGQPVWLSSNGVRREARRIVNIRRGADVIVYLDGEPDLARFLTAENAVMNAYLPGTVNSKQVIYIPSDGPPSGDESLPNVPGINMYDPLLRVGGVDWLLDSNLDLVVTPYGDNPLAVAMTALIQGAMVAFKTPKGSLLQHPQWGLGIKVGTSVADIDLPGYLQDLQTFFEGDPAIGGLQSASTKLVGNTLLTSVELGIRGSDQTIPLLLPYQIQT